jgi:hypothetical protein
MSNTLYITPQGRNKPVPIGYIPTNAERAKAAANYEVKRKAYWERERARFQAIENQKKREEEKLKSDKEIIKNKLPDIRIPIEKIIEKSKMIDAILTPYHEKVNDLVVKFTSGKPIPKLTDDEKKSLDSAIDSLNTNLIVLKNAKNGVKGVDDLRTPKLYEAKKQIDYVIRGYNDYNIVGFINVLKNDKWMEDVHMEDVNIKNKQKLDNYDNTVYHTHDYNNLLRERAEHAIKLLDMVLPKNAANGSSGGRRKRTHRKRTYRRRTHRK